MNPVVTRSNHDRLTPDSEGSSRGEDVELAESVELVTEEPRRLLSNWLRVSNYCTSNLRNCCRSTSCKIGIGLTVTFVPIGLLIHFNSHGCYGPYCYS